ncbi:TPA: hypothetical protein GXZ54_06925 [bacterium]|nr:hypothetical protein [bacterium]
MYWFSVIYNVVVILVIFILLYRYYLLKLKNESLPNFNKKVIILSVLLGIGVVLFILTRNSII